MYVSFKIYFSFKNSTFSCKTTKFIIIRYFDNGCMVVVQVNYFQNYLQT